MTLMRPRICSRCRVEPGDPYTCQSCQKALRLLRDYNITPERRNAMIAETNGRCPICRKKTEVWCIDHDHACCPGRKSCGKCVRGVLCAPCNRMLGIAEDSRWRLQSAIRYLDRHPLAGSVVIP